MIPAGYLAKKVSPKPDWLKAPQVTEIYSLSECISENFADYVNDWKHNGFWLFDSPDAIRLAAQASSSNLAGTHLFYYEVHEQEFDGSSWRAWEPEQSLATNVLMPTGKQLDGFDVVTFSQRNLPECSPLSCNGLAAEISTNAHCLLPTFEEAYSLLSGGLFNNSEPGPYRIFSVYSTSWPFDLGNRSH